MAGRDFICTASERQVFCGLDICGTQCWKPVSVVLPAHKICLPLTIETESFRLAILKQASNNTSYLENISSLEI